MIWPITLDTPSLRFAGLHGFPWCCITSNYLNVSVCYMFRLDDGRRSSAPICLPSSRGLIRYARQTSVRRYGTIHARSLVHIILDYHLITPDPLCTLDFTHKVSGNSCRKRLLLLIFYSTSILLPTSSFHIFLYSAGRSTLTHSVKL